MMYADRYRRDDPDRKFLQSREWREDIRPRQLDREPLCRFCRAIGITKPADQVDHIKRPRGDLRLQRDPSNFQCLCASHHTMKSVWERGNTKLPLVLGTTLDGWTVMATGGTIQTTEPAPAQPVPTFTSHKPSQKTFSEG
ncbi:HNH endonuclease signature motif containing protein [Rhizobium sp. Leaf386]|uniref:HNH endonuclease signature motif containing protein n=1 Tax=Rhizobium sp. Leaf386 TaxID=1736359 RepID=UPI0007158943|nr:HNH endonuclease signature motif containing protein [Rhizobium sp. Leaf386]KQT04143.1 hypothetical protein ASG50_18260 [Rhizobium sp. Leaf386]